MERIPTERLRSLSSRFNIYRPEKPVDRELLARDLYPPLPVSADALVWGFPFLEAAEAEGKAFLLCSPVTGSDRELLELSLRLEARRDRYAWEEKSAILSLLLPCRAEAAPTAVRSVESICALVSSTGSFIPQTEKYRTLPDVLKQMVNEGLLDLRSASGLSSLPPAALGLFREERRGLSFSSRRFVLQMLHESARRDGLGEAEIEARAREVLASPDPERHIRAIRKPVLTALEEKFESLRKDSLGGSGVELTAPASFEGGAFSVSFSFRTARELTTRVKALRGLQDHCDELFDLLR